MAILADIGTFVFGTYSDNLAKGWNADRAILRATSGENISELISGKFRGKSATEGLGKLLGMNEAEVAKLGALDDTKRLEALKKAAAKLKPGTNNVDLVKVLQEKLNGKYTGGTGATSLWQRFKTNFNVAKKEDLVHKLFTREQGITISSVAKGISSEVKGAWNSKAGSSFLAQLGAGAGKFFTKAMPLVGAALSVAVAVPNIIKASSNYGAGEGVKQTVKEGLNLGGMAAGAAIGTALIPIPILGSIIGGMIGYMGSSAAGNAVLGKSKIETQDEIEASGVSKDKAIELTAKGVSAEEAKQTVAVQQQTASTVTNPFATAATQTPQQQSTSSIYDPFKTNTNLPFQNAFSSAGAGFSSTGNGFLPTDNTINPYLFGGNVVNFV